MLIKVNSKGINDLLHSPGVKADLKRRAENAQRSASEGMTNPEGMLVADASDHNRARYVVITTNAEAMQGEAVDRRLTQSIDAARE